MDAGGGGDGDFSPRATVEDIQRRLLRPSSLHSPPPTPFSRGKGARGRNSSQFVANSTGLYRKREAKEGDQTANKKRKLEDYLDPILLSAVSSKIGGAKKVPKMTVKREVRGFEWPVDELRMLMEDSAVGKEKISTVNLGNDSDNLIENDEDVKFSTPFQKFEQTALVLFEL